MQGKQLNLLGKRFGSLVVLSRIEKKVLPGYPYKWLCQCDCGKQCSPKGPTLVNGTSKSCGSCKWKDRAYRQILAEYKQSAKRRNISWELSEENFRLLTSLPCHYTGRSPDKTRTLGIDTFVHNGVDRLDSNKGYTVENCVPCCTDVNRAKLNMEYLDFIKMCAEVTKHVGQ